MTHIDLNDPRWQTAPISVWGPAWWSEFHEVLEKVPCSTCQPKAVRDGRAFHDVVNAEIGHPVRYPENLIAYQKKVDRAVQACHKAGRCSPGQYGPASCPRMERCILRVKEAGTARNPFAVCRASVKC